MPKAKIIQALENLPQTKLRNPFSWDDERVVQKWYRILNKEVFDSQLKVTPRIIRIAKSKQWWNSPDGELILRTDGSIDLLLCKTFPCFASFIAVLAHEMVHQHEAETYGRLTHGKNFWVWKDKLADFGIPLRLHYCRRNGVKRLLRLYSIPRK